MKKSMLLMGLSALSISAVAMSAQAAGSNPSAAAGLVDLSELNLIVLGNMSGGDDVEGKTFVGGNLSNAATYGSGRGGAAVTTSNYLTLTVGGNAYSNMNIDAGSSVPGPEGALIGGNAGTVSINGAPASLTVGGSVGNFNPNGDAYSHNAGSSIATQIASTTVTLKTDIESLSTALAALPTTAGYKFTPSEQNNPNLYAGANSSGYAVIDMTTSELESAASINLKDITVPTIINVTGTTYVDNSNNNSGNSFSSLVLWNFEDATSITLNRQFEGSILAPYATLSNSTDVEGSVAVAAFNQGGEVHLGTFTGSTAITDAVDPAAALPPPPPVTSPAPEPAVWTMMIAGVGLVGFALRRRRAAGLALRTA